MNYNFYLLEFPNTPKLLSLDDICYLGRDEENTISIESEFISRRHTSIYFEDGSFYLKDMGSANGSFVNSKKTDFSKLNNGDQVGIGDRIYLFYKELKAKGNVERAQQNTAIISEKISVSRKGQMLGDFNDFKLLELLQYLSTRHRTGVLMLKCLDGSNGTIEFREGHIEHSFYHGNSGEEAVKNLLKNKMTDFQFDPKHKTDIVSIDMTTSLLFLEMFKNSEDG